MECGAEEESCCPGAETPALGECVLTDDDLMNCGGCGEACAEGEVCLRGVCAELPSFVTVPAGTFIMGSPPTELGRTEVWEKAHQVTLTRSFELSVTEVTQRQWVSLIQANPSHDGPCETCPVETVNWWESLAYSNAVSDAAGLPRCYTLEGCDGVPGEGMECGSVRVNAPDGNVYECEGYRLPTEAEWEYAARGGTQTAFFNGVISVVDCEFDPVLDMSGWYCSNSQSTKLVGQKSVNSYGLYDVHGNVYEWVWDWFVSENEELPPVDPVNDVRTNFDIRVLRGGSWNTSSGGSRAAARTFGNPHAAHSHIGVRLARSLP